MSGFQACLGLLDFLGDGGTLSTSSGWGYSVIETLLSHELYLNLSALWSPSSSVSRLCACRRLGFVGWGVEYWGSIQEGTNLKAGLPVKATIKVHALAEAAQPWPSDPDRPSQLNVSPSWEMVAPDLSRAGEQKSESFLELSMSFPLLIFRHRRDSAEKRLDTSACQRFPHSSPSICQPHLGGPENEETWKLERHPFKMKDIHNVTGKWVWLWPDLSSPSAARKGETLGACSYASFWPGRWEHMSREHSID